MWILWWVYRGQRSVCGRWFSPFTTRILEVCLDGRSGHQALPFPQPLGFTLHLQIKITYPFDIYCVCDGVAKGSLVYDTKLGWREE